MKKSFPTDSRTFQLIPKHESSREQKLKSKADKRYKLAFLTTGKYQYVNKTKIAGNLSRSGIRGNVPTSVDLLGKRAFNQEFASNSLLLYEIMRLTLGRG